LCLENLGAFVFFNLFCLHIFGKDIFEISELTSQMFVSASLWEEILVSARIFLIVYFFFTIYSIKSRLKLLFSDPQQQRKT